MFLLFWRDSAENDNLVRVVYWPQVKAWLQVRENGEAVNKLPAW